MVEIAEMLGSCKTFSGAKTMYEDKDKISRHVKVIEDNNHLAEFYKALRFKMTETSKQDESKHNILIATNFT